MKLGQKWYKNRLTWVVIVAVCSACALLIIQGIWLKRTFENETERLNQDLNRALPEFLFYRPDLGLLEFVASDQKQLETLKQQVEHSIGTSLRSNNITADFAFALLNSSLDSILLTNMAEYKEALIASEYQKCINCQQIKYLPLDSLTKNNEQYDYLISVAPEGGEPLENTNVEDEQVYISLYFPEFDQMILKNILSQLILVIVFVVLIVACFFYILRIVFRQKKVSEIKDDFINSLTHEFKTPLASMSLATTVLRESLSKHLTERDEHHFNLMRNEQINLEGQIDKVLQMAMADAGNFELEPEHIDLYLLAKQTIDSLELIAQQKGGTINLTVLPGNFSIYGDNTHMANVLYNLIDNALKYCNQAPLVNVEIKSVQNNLSISIKDNGVGINTEVQKVIFDKFYRVHQTEGLNAQGFGLGLSYVKRIIKLHGGEVLVSSIPGEGSIFTLNLPAGDSHV